MEHQSRSFEENGAEKGIPVPDEVKRLMSTGVWPTVRMADLMYNSLLKRPHIIFQTPNKDRLIGQDFVYHDAEVVSKKVRKEFKEEQQVNNDYNNNDNSNDYSLLTDMVAKMEETDEKESDSSELN